MCVCPLTFSKIFFSETAWPIKAKFYVEHPWVGGTKVCVFYLDRIRTLVAMATYASHRLIMEKSENCLWYWVKLAVTLLSKEVCNNLDWHAN